jgi:FAD synthase
VVSFVARIRGEERFESLDALRHAIAADAETARRIVSSP